MLYILFSIELGGKVNSSIEKCAKDLNEGFTHEEVLLNPRDGTPGFCPQTTADALVRRGFGVTGRRVGECGETGSSRNYAREYIQTAPPEDNGVASGDADEAHTLRPALLLRGGVLL